MQTIVQEVGTLTINNRDWPEVVVERGHYRDGSLALTLANDEGPILTATVSLPEAPPPGHVYIKEYSENVGVTEALQKAGVITPVSTLTVGGHGATVVLARLRNEWAQWA